MLLAMPPENVIRTSVPPAITNQVLTSWLLTTSPRSSASSNRFWVGSSDFSVSSSAISPSRQSEFFHLRMSLPENRCPLFRDARALTPVFAGYALIIRRELVQHAFDRA